MPVNRFISILLAGLVMSGPVKSADDRELWLSTEIEHKVVKKLSVGLKQEFRRDEDYSRQKSSLTSLDFSYRLNPHLRIISNYRYGSYTGYSRQRLGIGMIALTGKTWRFDNRTRYQIDFREDQERINIIRNRFRITWAVTKKIKPFLSLEGFLTIDGPAELVETRLSGGFGYKISKLHSFKLFYHLKTKNLNESNPDRIDVIGFRLGINI